MDDSRFKNAIHALNAALHSERCDPADVTITMPEEQWWRLYSSLERQFRGIMPFDGRGHMPDEFKYMGITFIPGPPPAQRRTARRAA